MGRTGWLMLFPTVLTIVAMGIWAQRISFGAQLDAALPIASLLVFIAFAVWGCIGRGQSEANTFGPPVVA
jgi:hypothetical protein